MHHLGLSADDVLTTTRAVRRRLDISRPVPREIVGECVRIATQAPSGRNRQRWDFVIVDDPVLRAKVADVWRRGLITPTGVAPTAGSRTPLSGDEWSRIADSVDRLAAVLQDVPTLLIAGVRVDGREELTTVRGQAGAWGSVLPALWSFMLAARERGIGTAWTTCHLSYEHEMAELLGIPYDRVVQAALTPVAYTTGTSFRPAPRADPSGFVHWNSW
ncbi:nitroreductase family protein [Mycolicibacterium sp. CBM1]